MSTQDDPKFSDFAIELAKRVAAKQKPGSGTLSPPVTAPPFQPEPTTAASPKPAAPKPVLEFTPETYFGFLPAAGKQGDNKYVAQDVFGYSFLADVFMADYKEGDVTWQGFLRPYRDDKEAREVLARYIASVKQDGADIKNSQTEGADEMITSASIGLFDVVFRKGNTLAGANGATGFKPAEAFARALAKSLPSHVPAINSGR